MDWIKLYRSFGFIPFPICKATGVGKCVQHGVCQKAGKRPLLSEWEKLTYEDNARLDDVFNSVGDCNIGLLCGDVGNLVVLDIDGPAGSESLQSLGGIKEEEVGPIVTTGKVGGYHYYFLPPEGRSVPRRIGFRQGLDLIGEKGFIIAPPSVHQSGTIYKFVNDSWKDNISVLPDRIFEWIDAVPVSIISGSGMSDFSGLKVGQRAQHFLSNGAQYAQREEAVNAIVNLLGTGHEEDYIVEVVSNALINLSPQLDPRWPWTEADVMKMVNSFAKTQLADPKPIESTPRFIRKESPIVQSNSLFVDAEDDTESDVFEEDDIIQGIIPRNQLIWVFAESNSGKTLLVLDWARHIAAGRDWCGRKVEPSKVLLIEIDDPFQIKGYVRTLREANQDLVVPKGQFVHNSTDDIDFHLKDQDGLNRLLQVIEESAADVVILDHFEGFVSIEHFNQRELSYFAKFKNILKSQGKTIIVIDHTTKSPAIPIYTGKGSDAYIRKPHEWLRGGQLRFALFDRGIALDGSLKSGEVKLWWAKLRGPSLDPLSVSFNQYKGFEMRVLPQEELSSQEHMLVEAVQRGYRTLEDLAKYARISEYQARVAINTRLILRNLIRLENNEYHLGTYVPEPRKNPVMRRRNA